MALYAVVIAVVASFGEMLSKYESKVVRDILNQYLLLYLAINGFFAYVTYYFLPDIAQYVLKPEYATWAQGETWGRVFVSAFGYLVIVRAKFITIKDTPIGIDTLYDTFARYCLRHTNIKIANRQDRILNETYNKHKELKRYEVALEMRITSAPESERETIRAERNVILSSTLPDYIKCKRLGELLLRIVGTKDELERALASVPPEALS
jgi:hypothetical protein